MKTGLIYKITNQINNKCYIGLTTRTFEERKREYFYYFANSKLNSPIFKAFEKYGIDAFKFELIEDNISDDILDAKEVYYIKKFNSKLPFGYNATEGGRVEGTRSVGRSNAKGVYQIEIGSFEVIDWAPSVTEMARRVGTSPTRISDVCNRKNFTTKGYIFRFDNDYSKNEVEDFHNTKRPDTHKSVIGFYLYRDGIIGEYPSIYQASKETGLEATSISEYCKGLRDRAGIINGQEVGFKYKDDIDGNLAADLARKVRKYKTRDIYDEPVVLYNKRTGESYKEFDSIKAAEKAGFGTRGRIKKYVLGELRTVFQKDGDDYTWRLVD